VHFSCWLFPQSAVLHPFVRYEGWPELDSRVLKIDPLSQSLLFGVHLSSVSPLSVVWCVRSPLPSLLTRHLGGLASICMRKKATFDSNRKARHSSVAPPPHFLYQVSTLGRPVDSLFLLVFFSIQNSSPEESHLVETCLRFPLGSTTNGETKLETTNVESKSPCSEHQHDSQGGTTNVPTQRDTYNVSSQFTLARNYVSTSLLGRSESRPKTEKRAA